MMKKYILLIFILFIISCNNNKEPIKLKSINVLVKKQHPFLVDHSRLLLVKNSKNIKIDSQELHDDPNGNTPAYLFEDKDNYILIDTDGKWYYISKLTGIIKEDKNYDPFIRKELPKNYIGTFIFINGKKEYKLEKKTINEKTMYKFGGGNLD